MYNNKVGKVIKKELQLLEQEEATYNFEVEDNHNYYVSEESILVHNDCLDNNEIESFNVLEFDATAIAMAKEGNPTFQTFKRRLFKYQNELTPNLFTEYDIGLSPKIKGKKVILHHPKGRVDSNLYNVVGVTQAQHLEIHGIIGYRNPKWELVSYNLGKGVF